MAATLKAAIVAIDAVAVAVLAADDAAIVVTFEQSMLAHRLSLEVFEASLG
ncbi:hypothetical protein PF005_g29661 [Phytophthora fragariae]|uniref:Uncharacterized protein n=1 Tax=Phytophthora fragariae TaxID=53985 RepID=A0A6A3PX43_9STRA|nr:hypothetical protein PF003_g21832 [Phytophthora fragariae]KAE8919669.1 hypothetical protein PF009_g30026 [Phytophthora fragariae]KAE9062995.1 hypothetical protein PF010_g29170 [Phytophthora fragariae]KAE9063790.1 hypothetical protein PF007_g29429 [Phytophthora fragariae]KAE9069869.1 hypothetical protein PF006_g29474 [Phytophthora fragariae]